MDYGYKKQVNLSFADAVSKAKEELKKEEFGVLTEIDVKDTMKKKIDADYDNYIILGACNPVFAHKALQTDKQIGLFLPCNVIVYEDGGSVVVSAIMPTVAMGVANISELADVAREVEEKLKRVVDGV